MLWWTLQQLKSKNPEVRIQAIEKLREAEDERTVEVLILSATQDSESMVRLAAIRQIKEMRCILAQDALLSCLKDTECEVQEAAAAALIYFGDRGKISVLTPLLKAKQSSVRWLAAKVLESMSWSPNSDQERALLYVSRGELDRLVDMGEVAVEALGLMLGDDFYYKRQAAVETLGRIGGVKVMQLLVSQPLRDSDSHVKVSAIETLGRIGDNRVVDPLILSLRDTDNRVREAAAEALSFLGDIRAVQPLALQLKDSSWNVRKACVAALALIGRDKNARVTDPLVTALQDRDPDVRQSAVSALGEVKDHQSIKPLILALKDPHNPVRQAAAASLRKVEYEWELTQEALNALPELKKDVNHKDYWVRQSAVEAIDVIEKTRRKLDPKEFLGESLPDKKDLVIDALSSLLTDDDRDFRLASAQALGRVGDRLADNLLASALHDSDSWVRISAAESLEGLNWSPKDISLKARYFVILQNWDSAAALGEPAVEALLGAKNEHNVSSRLAAAEALWKMENPKAFDALAEFLQDDSEAVRKAAVEGLVRANKEPRNPEHRAMMALELEEWDRLSMLGRYSIPGLVSVMKNRFENAAKYQKARETFLKMRLHGSDCAGVLLGYIQDPEVSEILLERLFHLAQTDGPRIPVPILQRISQLQTVEQHEYEFDTEFGGYIHSGMKTINCKPLQELCSQLLDQLNPSA